MDSIIELIKKLCPNGVNFYKLEELLDYEQPTKYIVKSTEYNDEFNDVINGICYGYHG